MTNNRLHRRPFFRAQRGFTLAELSIVLVIIAVIVGSALSMGTDRSEAAKIRESESKIQRIDDALVAFFILNGRMPCPADPYLGPDSTQFGKEERTAGGCSPTSSVSTQSLQPTSATGLRIGAVPTATLNMPGEFMKDGWNNRYTYVVDANFATDAPTYSATPTGVITINDNASTPNIRTTEAILVLISHGANGDGAWQANGARSKTAPTNPGELDNTETVTNFDSFDAIFTQASRSSTFDDIVRYRLKNQMVRSAGGVINTESCELAARTLRTINDTTDPKEGPVGCDEDDDGSYDQDCVIQQTKLATAIDKVCSVRERR